MPVDSRIAGAVQQFAVGAHLVNEAVKDLSREATLAAPGKDSTCMLWNYGHVTNSRCGLLMMLGVEHERFHNDLFGRGASHADFEKYPDIDLIQAAFAEVTGKLLVRFETLTDEELPRDFPIADKSVAGAITFLALHEIYHAGQMAYLRKWLGKGQLVG